MISLRDGAMAGAALLWKISFRMARAQDAITILNGLPNIKTAASADKSDYNGLLTHAKAAYEYHHHLAKLEFYSLGLMSYLSNIMDFAEGMQADLSKLLAKEPQDKI